MTSSAAPYADADQLADHWWWRAGWSVGTRFYTWHITLGDQPALRALVRAYQQELRHVPTVDLVPEQWLHITIQGVGHVAEIPDNERDAVVAAVRRRLTELPPATMTFHRAVLHREAVVIPPAHPKPLQAVRHAIRDGIADVWGPDRVPDPADGFRPHVSAAYVNTPGSPASLRTALDRARAEPVTTTLRTASLIALHRDRRMYEWITCATAPIGTQRQVIVGGLVRSGPQ